mmetsp:Transcript_17394/g.28828  ORF Transcript_17394/g.28828 Transcript_17394/m.28828 type:complete len:916 (+) Transcript_17394:81-2828(+)
MPFRPDYCLQCSAHIEALETNVAEQKHKISDLEQQLAELKAQQQELQAILRCNAIVIFALDGEGNFTLSLGKGLKSLGLEHNQVVGKNVFSDLGYDEVVCAAVRKVLNGESNHTILNFENRFYETYYEPIDPSYGVRSKVCGVILDVTPQRLAESSSTDSLYDMISRHTLEGKYIYVSPSVVHLLGYLPEELVGLNPYDLFHPDDIQLITETHMKVLENTTPNVEVTYRIRHKDGQYKWINVVGNLVRSPEGTPREVICSSRDVTEKIKHQQELQKALDEAKSASQLKSEFIAVMSHELRTPLNSILGFCVILADTPLDSTQRDFVDSINTSANALQSLLCDVLDFSRLEAGRVDLHNEVFDLRTCLEESLDIVAPAAAEKRLVLACIIDPDLPVIFYGDNKRLRQITLNMLTNGVKFTPKGHVYLVATGRLISSEDSKPPDAEEDSFAKYTVKGEVWELIITAIDTGIGIPADRFHKLFQPFSQIDSSRTRKYGGTGLGLVISKRLAVLMGGDISVESVLNSGSTFRFTVRVSVPPPDNTNLCPIPPRGPLPYLLGKKVLVMIDSEPLRRHISAAVVNWGMKALSFAPSEWQAVPPIPVFDCIILDGGELRDFMALAESEGPKRSLVQELLRSVYPRVVLMPFGWHSLARSSPNNSSSTSTSPTLVCPGETTPANSASVPPMGIDRDMLTNHATVPYRVLVSPPKAAHLYESFMSFFMPSYGDTDVTITDATAAALSGPTASLSSRLNISEVRKLSSRASPATKTLVRSRTASFNPLRILIADDVILNQKVAVRLLQRLGYNADVASDGEEAVAMVEAAIKDGGKPYDVVLMDVHMPRMDGVTATRFIRDKIPGGKQPRIIAMTADAMCGHRELYLSNNLDDYIPKPVRSEDLEAALSRCSSLLDVPNGNHTVV